MKGSRLYNAEYSALQGFFWMIYSVAVGFAAVFLRHRGYSNLELGLIIAAGNVAAIILQPQVAAMIDRGKWRLAGSIIAVLCLMPVLQLCYLLPHGRSPVVAVCYGGFVCCTVLVRPLVNSMAGRLEALGGPVNFGVARGVGSLSYAAVAAVLGLIVEWRSPNVLPIAAMVLSIGMLTLMLILRRQTAGVNVTAGQKDSSRGAIEFLRSDKRFAMLLVGLALTYFSHSIFNTFPINVVEAAGGNSADMGLINAYAAALELPAMFLFSRLMRRFRVSDLLKFSVIMFTAKGLAIYLAPSVPALYAALFLQAISFALYIPASVNYVLRAVAPADRVKGQAFLTSVSCVGSVMASLVGGAMFDGLGVGTTMLIAALVSALGAAIAVPSIKKTQCK